MEGFSIKLINLSTKPITVSVTCIDTGEELSPLYGAESNLLAHDDMHFDVTLDNYYAISIDGNIVRKGYMAHDVPGYRNTSNGKHAILTWDGKTIGSYKGHQMGKYLNHVNNCSCDGCKL